MNTIGQRLRMIRKKESLHLKDVGVICGITDQTVSRYERDQRSPENEFLKRFVTHFKINTDWLLFGTRPIYKVSEKEKDVKKSFIELSETIQSQDVPGIDPQRIIDDIPEKLDFTLQKITDDIPENYLLLIKCMMKSPIIRKGILQYFYLFLKPMIDNHPGLSESDQD
jgi:transcriptional regulator with XRE-family HTH domain